MTKVYVCICGWEEGQSNEAVFDSKGKARHWIAEHKKNEQCGNYHEYEEWEIK